MAAVVRRSPGISTVALCQFASAAEALNKLFTSDILEGFWGISFKLEIFENQHLAPGIVLRNVL